MSETLKKLYGGTLGTASANLYTASATGSIIKMVSLANKLTASVTASLLFDGIMVIPNHAIAANDALSVPMTHILDATKVISGSASVASAVDAYISGIEVG